MIPSPASEFRASAFLRSRRRDRSRPSFIQLSRAARLRLYRALAPAWTGTKSSLKRAVAAALKPHRTNLALLARILRHARFASLVAAAFLTQGVPAAFASPPIELSDVAAGTGGFVINGIDPDDWSGASVSNAGDVNGDGVADLIVGARLADPGGDSEAGESYVVFGKADGTPVDLSAVVAGTGGFVINGIDADDQSGRSVSTAGDINGDGLADLIVGADHNGSSGADAYVIFGKADGTAVELSEVAAGSGGFVISGINIYDQSALDVSSAGDVNGDGIVDLIVGASLGDPGGVSEAGESYVVFGKADGAAVDLLDVAGGTGGFVINGIDAGDRAGASVSDAGDVNGDGLADLIVGADRADPGGDSDAGESYVVFGKLDGTAVDLSAVAAGTGGFVINGIDADDRSGFSVSGAGDVNGDGFADLIIGAPVAAFGVERLAGESYVVFGKLDGTAVELSTVAAGSGGFIITGGFSFTLLGSSVSSAGDVNSDGLADVIVGVPDATAPGRSCVVFGKTDAAAVEFSDVAAGMGGFVMNGIDAADRSGGSISNAGDVNGDGLGDLIVGAYRGDPGGDSDAGESYVVFSPETPPLVPPGNVPASATYFARSRAGDGPGGAPVVPTVVPDSLNDARVTIDYTDDDFARATISGASLEKVTLIRSKDSIGNLGPATELANVVWRLETNRIFWDEAEVTFKYVNHEIAGISGAEEDLTLFYSSSPGGEWIRLASTVDSARNEISATVFRFGYFAIGNGLAVQPLAAEAFWPEYE